MEGACGHGDGSAHAERGKSVVAPRGCGSMPQAQASPAAQVREGGAVEKSFYISAALFFIL